MRDRRYSLKYTMTEQSWGGWAHVWQLVCRRGAVHFHATEYDERTRQHTKEKFSGGVEFHYLEAFAPDREERPYHQHCEILKQPCWHDGSSMMATDTFIPLIEHGVDSSVHSSVFARFRKYADDAFWSDAVAKSASSAQPQPSTAPVSVENKGGSK